MKRPFSLIGKGVFAFALALSCFAVNGADSPLAPDNPASPEYKANVANNLKRLAAELGERQTAIAWFSVPAMSDMMRMPDFWPADGRLMGDVRIILAKNEFEAGSFQLCSFGDLKDVTLTVEDLKSSSGAVIPAKNIDVKIVKIWYQNGNRWTSYFADVGLKLCPELLLKDENMIKVDTANVANYARIKNGNAVTYEWISAPRELDPMTFNQYQEGFADAAALQPFELKRGEFKQFFVTVNAPADQAAGVYKGFLTVQASGAKKIMEKIPLSVRVLPFELPAPRAYREPERVFLASMMGGFSLRSDKARFGEKLGVERFRDELVNAKNHSLFYPTVDQTPEVFALLKEVGLPTQPMMGDSFCPWFARNFGGRLTFDNMMSAKKAAKKCSDFYMENLGHNDILVSYGDEQGTAFATTHRNFFKYYEEYGISMGCAGHAGLFYKGGYAYGVHPMGGNPEDTDRIKRWTDIGDKWIGFYASQHTGSENPQYMRRQHGLLGWMNGLNMTFNYEFATGPWNDLASELYKPMVIAYRNYGGTVDTLQWEGFREAIDDIRYGTLLRREIRKALDSKNIDRIVQAKKTLQYFAELNPETMDLDSVRAEMIEYILKLMALEKKG